VASERRWGSADVTGASLHVLRLGAHLVGFYEGRTPGIGDDPAASWVEDGALSLGICSYALVDGSDAIVYDTHVSVDRARTIRSTLERLGVRRIRVVLSHWHLDHVAGTEAFADCEIISNRLTAELLSEHRGAIEAGTHEGPPAIAPLVLPTTTFEDRLTLDMPTLRVELVQFDIHSQDETVIHLPAEDLLLAADTLEDTITYVSEPERLELHIDELERMRRLGAGRILPNHGSRERIERGGYAPTLIDATERYIRDLLATAAAPTEPVADLRVFVADQLAAGWIEWFEPYERVHRSNVEAVRARDST
jgi:cyclase